MFRSLSISKKILLAIVPLFFLFLFVSVAIYNEFQEQEMMEQAQDAAHTYADIIKEALVRMMVSNYEVDETFLTRVNELPHFDTLHILVNNLNLRDELLTERRLGRLETKYRTLSPHDDVEKGALATGRPKFLLNGDRFRAVIPFTASDVCQKCHNVPVGYALGATDMHISLERISQASRANWRRSFYIFIGFTVAAIAFGSLMFRSVISRPVLRLVDATKGIAEGDYDSPVASGNGDQQSANELSFLARKFDEMRLALKEKIRELDEANRNLVQRNRDVEEALRRLQSAQEELVRSERLAVTGKMTAQLSHEINNPIHNTQSLLESSLKNLQGNEKARKLISVALEEVSRMARLTKQMLDLYRTSVLEFERERVDIGETIRDVVASFSESLSGRNISVRIDADGDIPPAHGSGDKLKQVFSNLIANARDAMKEGGEIVFSIREEGGRIRINVSDTGAGIPPDHIGRVFDAFFTTKKEVSGVGLGLSVSYAIIQQHGGTISVKSAVGQGTTFTIMLPLVK
jgi:signal transduction histidine kinase